MEHNYIKTNKQIKDLLFCKDCPLSLSKKENVVELGTGNICTDTVFVIAYSKRFDRLKTLEDVYRKIYNDELLNNYYITYLPKCYDKNIKLSDDYEIIQKAIPKCTDLLVAEIKHYCPNVKKIILWGYSINDTFDKLKEGIFKNIKIYRLGKLSLMDENIFINNLKEALYV